MKFRSFFIAALLSVVNGQLVPGLESMPQFVQNKLVSIMKNTIDSLAGDGSSDILTDDAIVLLLSSENTLEPVLWDEEFLNGVLEGVNGTEDYATYFVVFQQIYISSDEFLQNAGIESIDDLTTATAEAVLLEIFNDNMELADQFLSTISVEGATIDDAIQDITSGIDTVKENYLDLLSDINNWTAINLSAVIEAFVAESVILQKLISQEMVGQVAAHLETAVTTLESAGLNLTSMDIVLAQLAEPLEVCFGTLEAAREVFNVQTLFNYRDPSIAEKLSALFNDGIQCGLATAEFAGADVSAYDQYLEYLAYAFLAVEKYFKVTSTAVELCDEYVHFSRDVVTVFAIMEQYKNESYLTYAIEVVEGVTDILLVQLEDVLVILFELYNSILEDVPFLENYEVSLDVVYTGLAWVETYLEIISKYLNTVDRWGGQLLENIIMKRIRKIKERKQQGAVPKKLRNITQPVRHAIWGRGIQNLWRKTKA